MCYWPSHIKSECKREKLVVSAATPDPDAGWELCPIRVLEKGIHDLLTARNKAKLAELTSDIDLNQSKRPKKPVQKYGYEDTSDDEENLPRTSDRKRPRKGVSEKLKQASDNSAHQKPPTIYASFTHDSVSKSCSASTSIPASNSMQTPNATASCENFSPNTPSGALNASNNSGVQSESAHAVFKSIPALPESSLLTERDIYRKLHYMQTAVDNNGRLLELILKKLENLETGVGTTKGTTAPENNVEELIPCKTKGDLMKLEEKVLKSTDALNKLARVFRLTGGADTKNLLHNLMKKLMTDEVAQQYTFKGATTGKGSLQGLATFKVLKDVIQKQKSDATDEYIKDVCGDWLTQAKFRLQRRIARAAKRANSANSNPDAEPVDTNSANSTPPAEPADTVTVTLENDNVSLQNESNDINDNALQENY
nr:PREDICTED: uncharacterized protein LOC109040630 [Bemisia tabaci]